jgi:hypothetical protein
MHSLRHLRYISLPLTALLPLILNSIRRIVVSITSMIGSAKVNLQPSINPAAAGRSRTHFNVSEEVQRQLAYIWNPETTQIKSCQNGQAHRILTSPRYPDRSHVAKLTRNARGSRVNMIDDDFARLAISGAPIIIARCRVRRAGFSQC